MAPEKKDDGSSDPAPGGRRCPICGKPSSPAVRPFCSKRCADIDLHRWLGGVYAVPDAAPPANPIEDHDTDDV